MFSYQWGIKELVKAMQEYFIRVYGADIWRDETGSNIFNKMSGDAMACMAGAVENSDFVVCFITRAYSTSVNCMKEFAYADQLKSAGELDMIFVMCEADFTPHSKPPIRGAVGMSIGRDIYYTCTSISEIPTAAQAIAERMGLTAATGGARKVAATVVKIYPVVTALYDNEIDADDELPFNKGDKVEVLKTEKGGWWFGRCNGKEGLFPVDYVNIEEMPK
jgi:hypothetical protein